MAGNDNLDNLHASLVCLGGVILVTKSLQLIREVVLMGFVLRSKFQSKLGEKLLNQLSIRLLDCLVSLELYA